MCICLAVLGPGEQSVEGGLVGGGVLEGVPGGEGGGHPRDWWGGASWDWVVWYGAVWYGMVWYGMVWWV